MDCAVGFEGEEMPFGYRFLSVSSLIVEVVGGQVVCAGGLTCDKQFIALVDTLQCLDVELRHADLFEEVGTLAGIGFPARGA